MNKTWSFLVAATLAMGTAVTAQAEGDAARGQGLYTVCTTCHGLNGEGMEAMNAPALAGREEWYIVRQLENFKNGVRGKDSRDVFGQQMAPMAMILSDKQAMEDVAAYLASLGD